MSVGISVPLPAYTFDPAIITKKAEDLGVWKELYAVRDVKLKGVKRQY